MVIGCDDQYNTLTHIINDIEPAESKECSITPGNSSQISRDFPKPETKNDRSSEVV